MDLSSIQYWVDKEPAGEYFLRFYLSWWPNAKFIHLIRDPRNVYASYKKRDLKNHRPATSIPSFAFAWSKSVRQAARYQKLVGEDNYYILHYEDLTADVSRISEEITFFLGIKDEEILYRPTKGLGQILWGGNTATGEKVFQIDSTSASHWQDTLSVETINLLECILKRQLEWSGYPLITNVENCRVSASVMLENALREIRFFLRHI